MGVLPRICCPYEMECRRLPGGTFTFDGGNLLLGNIQIPQFGPATPYPSTINVSGLPNEIAKVTVTIFGYTHRFSVDVNILLVGPDGTNTLLMSDVGGGPSTPARDITLTFDDNASSFLQFNAQLVSGTFKPTNHGDIENLPANPDLSQPSPPPTSPSVALSNFIGKNPNGTWHLFVADDSPEDGGSITSWKLSITSPETEKCTFTPL